MLTKFVISKTSSPVACITRRHVDRVASNEREYHDTWQAAKNALVAVAMAEVADAEARLNRVNKWLANARALTPPDEELLCHVCGQFMRIDSAGISNHVDENGTVNHEADADHVAYALDAE